MERSLKLNIVNNINKLLSFKNIGVEKLAEKSGLSVSGLYKSLKSGVFKIEALEKIAEALKVSPIALFASELKLQTKIKNEDTFEYECIYSFTEESYLQQDEHDKTKDNYHSTSHRAFNDYMQQMKRNNELKSVYEKQIEQKDDLINSLKAQLKDKTEILEFSRKENLFAYANLVNALLHNRTADDGTISPDMMNDLTRTRIFDEGFLKKLVDQGLISEADYLFFVDSIPGKRG